MIVTLLPDGKIIKTRRTQQQILSVLADIAGGMTAVEAARRHGVHPNTIGAWRRRYRGLSGGEIVHVRRLEEDNAALRRVVSRLTSENEAMREVLRKNSWGPQRAEKR